MSSLRIWLIGEVQAPELSDAVGWLRSMARCESCADASAAIAAANRQVHGDSVREEPDAIIFCQARPGQISREQVDEIQRAFPLSDLLALVGPWCEGEVRSGRPWPGVKRIYWHQWQPRLAHELTRLNQPGCSRLPRSATEVDALLNRGALTGASRPALIGVLGRRHCDFEALALALAAGGHHPVWIEPSEPLPVLKLDAIVVDGESDMADTSRMLSAILHRTGNVPALALCHFPRRDELTEFDIDSAMTILSKPYLVSDLLARLAELLSSQRGQLAASVTVAA